MTINVKCLSMLHHIRSSWHLFQDGFSRIQGGALALTLASMLGMTSPAASADDSTDPLLRHTAPHKWIDPFIPEKLPDLTYPEFFGELDKAKAQVFHGRYKQALITLTRVEAKTPAEVVAVAL